MKLLQKKSRPFIGTFRQLKRALDASSLMTVYHGLVESLLNYGIIVWGSVGKTILNMPNSVHKRIIKIMFNKAKMFPSKQLYEETMVKSIPQLHAISLLKYVWKTPEKMQILHEYETRTKQDLKVQCPRIYKFICQNNFLLRI